MDLHSKLKDTSTFPAEVYDNLPMEIKECTDQVASPREKDVLLASILTMLSGCFSNSKGKYDKSYVSPNLYCFIVAPPASKKGVMKFAAELGATIQEQYQKANTAAKEKYELHLKKWAHENKIDRNKAGLPPSKPKYQHLFIPGNSSSAAVHMNLAANNGAGIICETEGDSLTATLQQDWGNTNDLLRKGFHNETVSISRKTDDLLITIDDLRLAILLTGTPDQVPKLIGSVHNGLCSRFLFYVYSQELVWDDPTPCEECADLTDFFRERSIQIAAIKATLDEYKPKFKLTTEQFKRLNENFSKKLGRIMVFEAGESASSVFRLGVICFKIAMVLTILRNKESLKQKVLVCSDQDFEVSLGLTDVFFEHMMVIYDLLPNQTKWNPKMKAFLEALPEDTVFQRKEANDVGKDIAISEKSVGNYLDKLVKAGYVVNESYGCYRKLPKG